MFVLILLQITAIFWRFFISEEEQLFDEREVMQKYRLERLEMLPNDEPFKNFALAAI